jgi:succinoglycan biosynthesis transport protein ExoP
MESVQQQSFPSTEARVITAATRPLSKSSPKTLLVMGLSAMVGLAFGFMAAAWRDFADRVFRTVRQVESTLQTDCVALVPLVKSEDPGDMGHRRGVFGQGQDFADMLGRKVRAAASKFGSESAGTRDWVVPEKVTREPTIATKLRPVNAGYQTIVSPSELYSKIIDEPFSAFSESIRSIKVAIDMSPTVTGGRIIGFTSAVPGEGKSTTCAAVARWVATTGAKTLLVDCDLRNPTLSRALAPRTTAGLLQVVNGQSTFEKAVWSDSATGMKFLPAASVSTARLAHSSEILASIHTRKFLDSMRNHYDYVFVDFSPLMPIVDVRASTSLVDSYIFVVSWGNTRIEFVKQALNSAKGVYEHLLGVVLNKVDLGAIDRYDGSGGYYTHESYARYGYSE